MPIEVGRPTLVAYAFKSKWTWISVAATIAFWLYALAIKSTLGEHPGEIAIGLVPQIFRHIFAYDLSMNIGTAILVSRIISIFIGYEENGLREHYFETYMDKQRNFYDERIKEVSQSSFRGVYQSRFPNGLIDEVLAVGFSSKILRENLNLDYKLRNFDDDRLDGVQVEASAEFQMTNISNGNTTFNVSLVIPNPLNPDIKKYCRFIEYRRNFEIVNCDECIKEFHSDLEKSSEPTVSIRLEQIQLRPSETVNIMLVYAMAKEREDTELVRVGTPTKDIKVTIHNETKYDLRIGATAIHRVAVKDISPPHTRRVKEFRLPEFFLPNQGFIWFWKEQVQAPPPDTTVNASSLEN